MILVWVKCGSVGYGDLTAENGSIRWCRNLVCEWLAWWMAILGELISSIAFHILLSGKVLRITPAEVLASASKEGLCNVAGVYILRFVEDPLM